MPFLVPTGTSFEDAEAQCEEMSQRLQSSLEAAVVGDAQRVAENVNSSMTAAWVNVVALFMRSQLSALAAEEARREVAVDRQRVADGEAEVKRLRASLTASGAEVKNLVCLAVESAKERDGAAASVAQLKEQLAMSGEELRPLVALTGRLRQERDEAVASVAQSEEQLRTVICQRDEAIARSAKLGEELASSSSAAAEAMQTIEELSSKLKRAEEASSSAGVVRVEARPVMEQLISLQDTPEFADLIRDLMGKGYALCQEVYRLRQMLPPDQAHAIPFSTAVDEDMEKAEDGPATEADGS